VGSRWFILRLNSVFIWVDAKKKPGSYARLRNK
jgi:hypothetical protein